MAKQKTLGELINAVRAECFESLNASHSVDDREIYKYIINRTQRKLFDEYDWGFLKKKFDKEIQGGQKYFDLPEGLDLERIEYVYIKFGSDWYPIGKGINTMDYNAYDSDETVNGDGTGSFAETSDPPLKWDFFETETGKQFELWPIPASDTIVRFEGHRRVNDMVEDSDLCDLDADLISLFAAAEILEMRESKSAKKKEEKAYQRLATVRQQYEKTRSEKLIMGGAGYSAVKPTHKINTVVVIKQN